jgi:hypothetical protein
MESIQNYDNQSGLNNQWTNRKQLDELNLQRGSLPPICRAGAIYKFIIQTPIVILTVIGIILRVTSRMCVLI